MIAPASPLPLAFAASYISVLILLGVVLTFRVVFARRRARISLGDGEDAGLRKRIRAHGNFAEQAPWIALALIVLPFLGAREWMIHLVGVSGVTGRILHAIAVSGGDHLMRFRVLGMIFTVTALAAGVCLMLLLAWT